MQTTNSVAINTRRTVINNKFYEAIQSIWTPLSRWLICAVASETETTANVCVCVAGVTSVDGYKLAVKMNEMANQHG